MGTFVPDVLSYNDYYPFGMVMPKRSGAVDGYRYGFNGMEKDDEIKGESNSYTTHFRNYDPRIGRWLSLDPAMRKFPSLSPYVSYNNNPIVFTDPYGDDPPEDDGTASEGDLYFDPDDSSAFYVYKWIMS